MRARVPGGWWTASIVAVATLTVAVLVLSLLGRLPGQGSGAAAGGSPTASQPSASATSSATPTPVLQPVGDSAPLPTAAGLSRVLAPLLAEPALGKRVGVAVGDL